MTKSRLAKLITIAAVAGLAACQQNLTRTDGVTTHAGNSLAVNEAKSVVDPWPRNVENTHIEGDGQRLSKSVVQYKTNPSESAGSGLAIPNAQELQGGNPAGQQ